MGPRLEEIPLDLIEVGPYNPRENADLSDRELAALGRSIRLHGQIEAIVVRPMGDKFELVAGKRRFLALKALRAKKIEAQVKVLDDAEAALWSIMENVQRLDLTPVEKGRACHAILQKFPDKFPKQRELAEELGVSEATLSNWIKCLNLPREAQRIVAPADGKHHDGKLEADLVLRAARSIPDERRLVHVVQTIARGNLDRYKARDTIRELAANPELDPESIVKRARNEPDSVTSCLRTYSAARNNGRFNTVRRGWRVDPGKRFYVDVFERKAALAEVKRVTHKKLGQMLAADVERLEHGFANLKEFQTFWKSMYGAWDENEEVELVESVVVTWGAR